MEKTRNWGCNRILKLTIAAKITTFQIDSEFQIPKIETLTCDEFGFCFNAGCSSCYLGSKERLWAFYPDPLTQKSHAKAHFRKKLLLF